MSAKSFLAELFDANFNRFIITTIVKVLYVLGLVATTGVTAAFVLAGLGGAMLSDEPAVQILAPILVLTVAGILFLLGALLSRLVCESIVVIYRIAENTARLVEQGNRESAGQAEITLASPADQKRVVPAAA